MVYQFAVLHVWGMTVYDTLVHMDSDTLAIGSLDALFERRVEAGEFAAAQDFRYVHLCQGISVSVE